MSKYVLNENNALVLDGRVYALVREAEVTENSVCNQCALCNKCYDYDDSRHFADFCIPEPDDDRWFFVNAGVLPKYQQIELESYIEKNIYNLKFY